MNPIVGQTRAEMDAQDRDEEYGACHACGAKGPRIVNLCGTCWALRDAAELAALERDQCLEPLCEAHHPEREWLEASSVSGAPRTSGLSSGEHGQAVNNPDSGHIATPRARLASAAIGGAHKPRSGAPDTDEAEYLAAWKFGTR